MHPDCPKMGSKLSRKALGLPPTPRDIYERESEHNNKTHTSNGVLSTTYWSLYTDTGKLLQIIANI